LDWGKVSTSIGIEIHAGDPGRPHKSLGQIQARVGAATALSKTPTLEDVNFKLQEVAAKLGANGVINVTYDRGISMMSWKALTARGEAVIFEADEKSCPECAETIKMAAVKCRFCGAAV
jgi:rRNA maturation endonuclease Nob1